ncbi:MAG: hypothetical protein MUF46_04655 [Desulfobacterales bacterium]|nr:hypothetical protein [Desulfobacterales bacterium]
MVNGIAEFTRRFRKPVWLEVFLLEGLTESPADVERIAARVREIAPAKVQLNTVSRPPCEENARPVPVERLAALAALFEPPAEVISEAPAGGNCDFPAAAVADEDILNLIRIRPCTAAGVAAGSTKRLAAMVARGAAVAVRRDDSVFYETPRSAAGCGFDG